MTNKAVKKTALILLKNNWCYACTVTGIFILSLISFGIIISMLLSVSPLITAAFTLTGLVIIVIPLYLGMLKAFWVIADGKKADINLVFYYYSSKSRFKRSLEFSYSLFLNICFYGLALSVIPTVLTILNNGTVFEYFGIPIPIWTVSLGFAATITWIFGFLLFLVFTFKFYIAAFIFITNDNYSANKCLKFSYSVVKLTWTVIIGHIFSFAGWILLSLLFLPLIFTMPYFVISYITECRFSVAYYNSKLN